MKLDLTAAALCINEGRVLLVHHRKLGIWIPPGGHIDENETPDDALRREMREELNLDIEFLDVEELPTEGNIVRQCPLPIYANVHNVGDHDHYCLFYRCRPKNPEQAHHNEELHGYAWFGSEELERVPADVRNMALLALSK